ncbi:MAG: radical SAM protein [Terracidiphilus sp.]
MKSSQYNVLIPASNGRVVLFNTLYGSISLLEENEHAQVVAILNATRPGGESGSLCEQLAAQKHLIPDEVNEFALVEDRKRAGIKDSNTLDLIVLPTLNCNFRCVYCYETHRPSSMSPDTTEALKKWLKVEIPLHKVVMLYWFGGEPLLEYDTVLSVSRHVKSIAEHCGTLPVLHVTTNGYLLSAARAKELASSGIHDFQITVDGPPKTHDALRVLESGRGTFKRIFENICTLAATDGQVKITLRINFNHTNLDSVPELLEMFPLLLRPQLRVVFEPIFGNGAVSAVCNISQATLSGKLAQYSEKAAELGYDVVFGLSSVHPGKLVYCYAERESQYIVNFDGNVFKCSVCDFTAEHRVGQLNPEGVMLKNDAEWRNWVGGELFAPKCRSCPYLPLCMGGCRKTRIDSDSSRECALVATNASYLLKHIAFGGLGEVFNRL